MAEDNQTARFNAEQQNRGALQDAALETQTSQFNADASNTAGQFNAAAQNTAMQNFLNREQQTALQDDAQEFQAGENAADRVLQKMLSDDRIAFEEWSQTNSQEWNATENALQREFERYRTDAQTSATVMYSTMEAIAQIYADPNLTATAKQSAITNVMNTANSMPSFLSRLQSGMQQRSATENPDNYDENGVWTGDGFPDWAVAPDPDGTYDMTPQTLTNPVTGQTFIAPNAGWTVKTADQINENVAGNNSSTTADNVYTGDPNALISLSAGQFGTPGLFRDPNTNKYYRLQDGEYIEIDMTNTNNDGDPIGNAENISDGMAGGGR